MKIANSIKIKVFVKKEDDEERIRKKLLELIPFDIEKERIELRVEKAIGFNEAEIKIFRILLEKNRHIEAFLDNLLLKIGKEAKELLLKQAESRLDDECNFFLRLSKKKLVEENEFWITDQGNCFHIKINVAAFPKKRDIALEIIRNVMKG